MSATDLLFTSGVNLSLNGFRDLFSEAFLRVYEKMIQDEVEKARLMADPASAEGQRLIQEQIQLENLNYTYAQVQRQISAVSLTHLRQGVLFRGLHMI